MDRINQIITNEKHLDSLFPLTEGQKGLWFLHQLYPLSDRYNMPFTFRISSKVRPEILTIILRKFIMRHEVLRSTFHEMDGKPIQRIHPEVEDIAINEVDVTNYEYLRLCERVEQLAKIPFDLEKGPLVRASFLKGHEKGPILMLVFHHLIFDGASLSIMMDELEMLYRIELGDKESVLPPILAEFNEFQQWQSDWLNSEDAEDSWLFWKSRLQSARHEMILPEKKCKQQEIETANIEGAIHKVVIDKCVVSGLKDISVANNCSEYVVWLTAFFVLLYRYSGEKDLVVGTPVKGRPEVEFDEIVGYFVNLIPLSFKIDRKESFAQLLQRLKIEVYQGLAHGDFPLSEIISRLGIEDNRGDSTLFQVRFVWTVEDNSATAQNDLLSLKILPLAHQSGDENFGLEVLVLNDQVECVFKYRKDKFEEETIIQLAENFQCLLADIINNQKTEICHLQLLDQQQKHFLIHTLNDCRKDYPIVQCIHEQFEQQVANTPDNVALVFEEQQLTYAELNHKANRLAHYLREQGVMPDTLVGICVERSVEMVIGLLAILKAGGAYVPLDPSYPQSRLDYMIEDSGISLLLTQEALLTCVDTDSLKAVLLDEKIFQQVLQGYSKVNPQRPSQLSPDNLAYVIYTSGSTGQPKGVMVEHNNIVRLLESTHEDFKFCQTDVWTLFHSYAFDFSVWEIWGALVYGGRLIVVPHWISRSYDDFYQLLIDEKVTVLNQTPISFSQVSFVDAQKKNDLSLRVVIFGGEALNLRSLSDWVERHGDDAPQLVNMYGITETTVHVTYRRITAQDIMENQGSLIGHPLSDLSFYILDEGLSPVPMGVGGEIFVGGNGVSRGYLNRIELTQSRFIDSPFNAGQRLYRTGDLARYLKGGDIEYLGRIDDQVKIRGFRIELGEIEHQLSELAMIKSSLVIVIEDVLEQKQLVAYVIAEDKDIKESDLITCIRENLEVVLPDYMVPAFFVVMDEFPLTTNGKVDRKALPAPDASQSYGVYVSPATATEIKLAQIWANLLNLKLNDLSATANFFECGGHSLLSVRLVAEIRAEFGVELAIRNIFNVSQLSLMAQFIDSSGNQSTRLQVAAIQHRSNRQSLSFAQQRLWFIDQMDGGSSQYNMAGSMRVKGLFNESVAEQAFSRIIERHETLRTVFVNSEEGPMQVIRDQFSFKLTRIDLTHLSPERQDIELRQATTEDAAKVFDLSEDLMVRVSFIRLSAEEGGLLFNMHHIASDGWSVGVFVKEFAHQYESILNHQPNPYEPLSIQYADYAHWQRKWLAGEVLEEQLSYWEKQLADLPQVHGLPLERVRPKDQTFKGEQVEFTTDLAMMNALKKLALSHNATLFMALHGAFSLLISRHSNSTDIVMGTPVANRLQKELEPLIGFFVNTLVLRADCSGNPSFSDYLNHIKTVNLDAQANQDVPFEHLVERLKPARSTSHSPLFQIMLSMDNNDNTKMKLPGLVLSSLEATGVVAKFELTLHAKETEQGLYFNFEYNSDLFDVGTIERLSAHFNILLQSIVDNPNGLIAELPMLSEQEQHYLLHTLNDTQVDYPQDQCIHELFEEQVIKTPDNVALVFEEQQLTYAELNHKANRLAHYLREQGVKADILVGICVERSLEMVVGILAILKAGGAYVPLDPSYPQSRLDYMVADSGIKLLLTQYHLKERLEAESLKILELDDESLQQTLQAYSAINLLRAKVQSPDNLAYVIYTSGDG